MPTHTVNLSALLGAAFLSIACSPAGSTPSADASQGPARTEASQKPSASAVNDPMIAAADHGRVRGDSAAKTWVIIASDFQCPFCKEWHDKTYESFINEYVRSGKVKVAYVNYPLAQHLNAMITAQAAMCASAQNKFWEYHDALFNSQAKWEVMAQPLPLLDSLAKSVGVETKSWGQCVKSGRMLPMIRADQARLGQAGVQSTPSFMIGDQMLIGAQTIEDMRVALDSAVKMNSGSTK